ncbi:MAG: dTDP-4-dehydrorhamnose 3,5-epimerase [Candidatus Doudnabacteria bacterium]
MNAQPCRDDREGFFKETFRKAELENKLGYELDFKQTNHSRSTYATLRGIHIAPWHKLVTCTSGTVQQIVVDTRPHSPTFGQHISVMMGENNQKTVFIPKDCGNAFLVLSPQADYLYQTTEYWSPGKEVNVSYDDQDLNIAWANQKPLLSEKDQQNPPLKEIFANE